MRAVLTLLSVIALAVLVAGSATPAHAKTYIYVTPNSGPAGSTIHIEGFNFSSGEVRIAIAPVVMDRETVHQELPAGLITLATTRAVAGGFEIEVALPRDTDPKLAGRVEVLAIAEDWRPWTAKYFVTGALFDITTAPDLPVAGAGTAQQGQLRQVVSLLGLGGALLSGAGLLLWRRRA